MTRQKRNDQGPEPAARVAVVHVERRGKAAAPANDRDAASRLREAVGLAEAIDLEIVAELIVPLTVRKPATLIGSGKVEEITKLVAETGFTIFIT